MRAVLLPALVLAGAACAAAPPASLTPEQHKTLLQCEALWQRAQADWKAGAHADAVAGMRQALAVMERVHGPHSRPTGRVLSWIAGWEAHLGRWEDAARSRERLWRIEEALHGPDDWHAADARRQWADALAQVKRTPAQRDALQRANGLYQQAADLQRKEQSAKAVPLLKECQALLKDVHGERHPDRASALSALASAYHDLGDHAAARAHHLQANDIFRETLGEHHPRHAAGLNNLALLYKSLGDHARALPLARRAVAALGRARGTGHPDYAAGLDNLAQLHHAMGGHAHALALFEKALDLRRRVLGPRHPDVATTLNNLGSLHLDMGDHRRALPLAEESLSIRKEAFGARHPRYATALMSLAALHSRAWDHQKALSLLQQAADIRKKSLGVKHPLYAHSLVGLAQMHQALGDHHRALPLCQEALNIRKDVLGEKHPDYARALDLLAHLHWVMGDAERAIPMSEQALGISEEAFGKRHVRHAVALNNLAVLLMDSGAHARAMPLLRTAAAVRKEALGEWHPEYSNALNNLASCHQKAGDHEEAGRLLLRSLAIQERAAGGRHPSHATVLHTLGMHCLSTGAHAQALRLFRRALDISLETLGERHPDTVNSLVGVAGAYQALGRPGAALPLHEKVIALSRRQIALDASVMSERQHRAAAQAIRSRLAWRLSLPDEADHSSHTHALWWKGSVFAAQQDRRRFLVAQADPDTRRLADDLLDATRSLALLSSRIDAESRARCEALAATRESLEARLAEVSADFRLARRPPTGEQLRASLPPRVALVDFLAYDGTDPAKPQTAQRALPRLTAWVVRADAPAARFDLGPLAPVEKDIASWRRALESGRDPGAAPARLRKAVWAPLEKAIGGADTVLVSPDGPLGRLPFSALPGARAGSFLIEDVRLAILPVPQVLPRLLLPADGKPSLLAVGGVDFGPGGRWRPLAATRPETDAVVSRFRARLKADADALAGAEATKAAVRDALPRHRFAHLATHGFFAPASLRSADEAGLSRGPSRLLTPAGVAGWDPALLSGLVLAGANRPTPYDDGVLTASEVAEMDLSRLELAVLSACQTGLGKEAAGEGMLGLQRAFAVAGCKSVVGSLWSVNDAATSVLMERFYLHLWQKKNLSKVEALRQAQLDVMRHPEWVEARVKKLSGLAGLRGLGEAVDVVVAGKKERRSPVAWWAAWQLSGDWR